MSRTQFTFYESWYKAICQLKKKADQAIIYDAICKYALYAEEPDISGPPAAVFESIRPALDIARKKSENGKKGKAKAKENAIKSETNESKQETNKNKDETRNSNSNRYSNRTICYPSSLPLVEKKEERPGRFSPPSIEEVSAYVREKGYHIDPEAFVAFYESKGWKVGSNPMKDWKSAVVTWEKREKEKGGRANGIFGGYHGEDIPKLQADVRA